MTTDTQPKTLAQRLNAARAAAATLEKSGRVQVGGGYSYVPYDTYAAEVRRLFTDHGIGFWASSRMTESGLLEVSVTLESLDDPDDQRETLWYVPISGSNPQQFGAAISYGIKYALRAVLLLDAGDEDADHERYVKGAQQQESGESGSGGDETIWFGKHRGRAWLDVAQEAPDYLRWVRDNMDNDKARRFAVRALERVDESGTSREAEEEPPPPVEDDDIPFGADYSDSPFDEQGELIE